MAPWVLALLAGLVAGGALLLGSAIAWFVKVPPAVWSPGSWPSVPGC